MKILPFVRCERRHIAAFGVAKAYKNVACLVRSLPLVRARRPDIGLVLIGGDGGAGAEIQASGMAEHVSVRRELSDDGVRAIVRGASVFVVPSVIEGSGCRR